MASGGRTLIPISVNPIQVPLQLTTGRHVWLVCVRACARVHAVVRSYGRHAACSSSLCRTVGPCAPYGLPGAPKPRPHAPLHAAHIQARAIPSSSDDTCTACAPLGPCHRRRSCPGCSRCAVCAGWLARTAGVHVGSLRLFLFFSLKQHGASGPRQCCGTEERSAVPWLSPPWAVAGQSSPPCVRRCRGLPAGGQPQQHSTGPAGVLPT